MQRWEDEQDAAAAVCRAVGLVARQIVPLLAQGAVMVMAGEEEQQRQGGPAEEAVYLALLTMEAGVEKLELFPSEGEGEGAMLNRVDVSLCLDALELVLARCVAGAGLRGGGGTGWSW